MLQEQEIKGDISLKNTNITEASDKKITKNNCKNSTTFRDTKLIKEYIKKLIIKIRSENLSNKNQLSATSLDIKQLNDTVANIMFHKVLINKNKKDILTFTFKVLLKIKQEDTIITLIVSLIEGFINNETNLIDSNLSILIDILNMIDFTKFEILVNGPSNPTEGNKDYHSGDIHNISKLLSSLFTLANCLFQNEYSNDNSIFLNKISDIITIQNKNIFDNKNDKLPTLPSGYFGLLLDFYISLHNMFLRNNRFNDALLAFYMFYNLSQEFSKQKGEGNTQTKILVSIFNSKNTNENEVLKAQFTQNLQNIYDLSQMNLTNPNNFNLKLVATISSLGYFNIPTYNPSNFINDLENNDSVILCKTSNIENQNLSLNGVPQPTIDMLNKIKDTIENNTCISYDNTLEFNTLLEFLIQNDINFKLEDYLLRIFPRDENSNVAPAGPLKRATAFNDSVYDITREYLSTGNLNFKTPEDENTNTTGILNLTKLTQINESKQPSKNTHFQKLTEAKELSKNKRRKGSSKTDHQNYYNNLNTDMFTKPYNLFRIYTKISDDEKMRKELNNKISKDDGNKIIEENLNSVDGKSDATHLNNLDANYEKRLSILQSQVDAIEKIKTERIDYLIKNQEDLLENIETLDMKLLDYRKEQLLNKMNNGPGGESSDETNNDLNKSGTGNEPMDLMDSNFFELLKLRREQATLDIKNSNVASSNSDKDGNNKSGVYRYVRNRSSTSSYNNNTSSSVGDFTSGGWSRAKDLDTAPTSQTNEHYTSTSRQNSFTDNADTGRDTFYSSAKRYPDISVTNSTGSWLEEKRKLHTPKEANIDHISEKSNDDIRNVKTNTSTNWREIGLRNQSRSMEDISSTKNTDSSLTGDDKNEQTTKATGGIYKFDTSRYRRKQN